MTLRIPKISGERKAPVSEVSESDNMIFPAEELHTLEILRVAAFLDTFGEFPAATDTGMEMNQMLIVYVIETDSIPDFALNFFRNRLSTCNALLLSESTVPDDPGEQKRRYEIRVLLLIRTSIPVHSAFHSTQHPFCNCIQNLMRQSKASGNSSCLFVKDEISDGHPLICEV